MKQTKFLALGALAAAALTLWAGVSTASATTLDCEGEPCSVNTALHGEAEGTTVLHPPIGDIECKQSTIQGSLTNVGSSTTTAGGPVSSLTISECNGTVTVLATGSLEIHTRTASSDNNGTLTSSGTEVTIEFSGFHCIFKTNATDVGTVTGSATTGGLATLDIAGSIPRTGGRSGAFCGSTAQWTGSYKMGGSSGPMNVT